MSRTPNHEIAARALCRLSGGCGTCVDGNERCQALRRFGDEARAVITALNNDRRLASIGSPGG